MKTFLVKTSQSRHQQIDEQIKQKGRGINIESPLKTNAQIIQVGKLRTCSAVFLQSIHAVMPRCFR
ncbi:hypothetical protein SAMN04487768_3049 [Burkholderia sp. b13]|nr:hypothetical protein SAMN04487768_3049 [Burkholderia sp. b13]